MCFTSKSKKCNSRFALGWPWSLVFEQLGDAMGCPSVDESGISMCLHAARIPSSSHPATIPAPGVPLRNRAYLCSRAGQGLWRLWRLWRLSCDVMGRPQKRSKGMIFQLPTGSTTGDQGTNWCPATFQLSGVETRSESHNPWPKFLFQLLPRAWQLLENCRVWTSKLEIPLTCQEGQEDIPTWPISHHHGSQRLARLHWQWEFQDPKMA